MIMRTVSKPIIRDECDGCGAASETNSFARDLPRGWRRVMLDPKPTHRDPGGMTLVRLEPYLWCDACCRAVASLLASRRNGALPAPPRLEIGPV